MQLIKKLFGQAQAAPDESVQFQESQANTEIGSRNAPRRELVQVVLRDSMRRHGIPSAWIDCRILPVMSRTAKSGMHVQFIVRDGTDRLLTYVPAFQTSFMTEISRFDPRVEDWLFSVSWQFLNFTPATGSVMPDPQMFADPSAAPTVAKATPPAVATVKEAPPEPAERARVTAPPMPVVQPAANAPVPAATATPDRDSDQEVLEDLQALYAIRDAAMRQGRGPGKGPAGEQDFENTQPGDGADSPAATPQQPRSW